MDNAQELKGYIEETWVMNPESIIFQDSTSGAVISKESITSMITDAKDDSLPKAIDVVIEATHTGVTKNFTEYVGKSMKSSSKTWMEPYAKPVLLGHDQSGPTLGRVKSAMYGKSILNPEKDTITLTLNITDKGSIKRHIDGTALTYSIGAQAKEVYCSICGTDILNSEEFCGHWKGNVYKIKADENDKKVEKIQCIWQIGNMEYLEVSEVNVPADPWAQRLSVNVPKEEPADDEEDSSNVKLTESTNTESNIADAFDLSIADEILAKEVTEMIDKVETPEAPEVIDVLPIVETVPLTDSVEVPAVVTEHVDTIPELTDKIAELNTLIHRNKCDYDTLIHRNKCEIETLTESNKALERAVELLTEEKKTIVDQQAETSLKVIELVESQKSTFKTNVELAKMLKKVYTDAIIDAKIILGEVDDSIDLSTKSVQELSNILTELRTRVTAKRPVPQITQANVGSEGALVASQDGGISIKKSKSETDTKAFSAKDAVDAIITIKNH